MSFSHPRRRTPVTRPDSDTDNALSLKNSSTLRKGATFHSPTSSSSTLDNTFVPPTLPRAQSHLDDVVDANRRRVALALNDIDEALSLDQLSLSPKSKIKTLRDTSLPIPRGFLEGPIVDPKMTKEEERRVLRPRSVRHSRHHESDSGLGTSVASTNEKRGAVTSAKKETKVQTRSAITRSVAAASEKLPSLGPKAINRIHEHTLRPLLAKPTLKEFEPIVLDIPRRIRSKEIICLRDLEKTLIFMAPVSQLLTGFGVWENTYRNLCLKEKTKSATLYLDFCLTSVQCIQATVEYLSDREQIRPADRPYTNGYFLDLKDQILQYGKQLAAKNSGDDMDIDAYVPSFVPLDYPTNSCRRSDEIKLIGGLHEGRPVELVRVRKDGTYISLDTGKPVEVDSDSPMQVKRSLSQQLEDEEEIQRSMARRKKNASPEELAPKKCREPGCNKEFKRPCDLTKHEKTHSRPWKCPVPTCKYHTYGWPTEKEMDRHHNDKHSAAPAMYECMFKPCPYKSKRESNCKQHMEKAHGWTYVRTKTNGKKLPSVAGSVQQQTPPLGNMSTPSSTEYNGVPTPPQNDVTQFVGDFPLYPNDSDWMSINNIPTETLHLDLAMDSTSPASASSYEQYAPYQNGSAFILDNEDLYAAHMQLPAQLPTPEQPVMYNPNLKMMQQQLPMYQQPQQQIPIQTVAPHFSPTGQETAMLYTPNSLRDVDEGFDDSFAGDGMDFPLFPNDNGNGMTKTNDYQSLFGEIPSANLGFSQNSQDIFQMMDWSNVDLQQNLGE
ncbi:zinc finger transcription factor ace1 [Fusarium oxysporum f. sp. raphani 54005]|uniref:Zinc finger transcription factor ace1 n=8 Tax=Fusarium oxysporum TaxID=5507 RepID=X0C109_FUSOX|nr:zinc finger transcription factor ace1 [Fusarium oxysporum f. sp. lycopersici 4287]EWZ50732.1 zinc finger transcription factor ace1 [Fusarium oxysporum Fo47]EWZ91799.1 zinc finger transcription factor ace1 [Fusarium oxysporum f. sp. lycopersici MN25]EXA53057.1 zinc finger transcription factor ace1 [Fusarium oxysporum f. sp. pisi HDV247]EXK47974.1 zinc finger transcription factor ace1 [Fusarium oxysporum f. sp. melonis 26406]EXK88095.1 zinc finger transcription factor ace1 [Fusarium oxysporum